jgi:hypothetical protein
MIDFIFLIDIIFNFRTTYVNSLNGLEVLEPKKIAINYLKQWRFYTDLLSIIPFEVIYELATKSKSKGFKIFDLLKLIRLLRLGRIITYMKFKQNAKIGFRIVWLLLLYLLISHWIGCLWYMVVNNTAWIPPKD